MGNEDISADIKGDGAEVVGSILNYDNLDITLSKGSNLDINSSKGLDLDISLSKTNLSKGLDLDISLSETNFDKYKSKTKKLITNNLISNKFVSVGDKNLVLTASKSDDVRNEITSVSVIKGDGSGVDGGTLHHESNLSNDKLDNNTNNLISNKFVSVGDKNIVLTTSKGDGVGNAIISAGIKCDDAGVGGSA